MRVASIGLAFVGLILVMSIFALTASAEDADKAGAVETRRVEVERLTIKSARPFQAVVNAVQAAVGHPNMLEFSKAIRNARSYSDIERLVDSSVSQSGLMLFTQFDDGEILRKESGTR